MKSAERTQRASRGGRRTSNAEGPPPRLLDIAGLAQQLGVTERFVRRLVEERRVPFHKIGKFVRFHPDDVDEWVRNQRVEQVNDY